jgi:hypothetical protein
VAKLNARAGSLLPKRIASSIILRYKFDDFPEVGDSAVRDQDSEVHRGSSPLFARAGRTKPGIAVPEPK